MLHSLKKYKLLYFFVYLTIWLSLSSTPLNEPFDFSARTNQIFTLLIYVPFGLLILWKLGCDLRGPKKNLANLMYYLLGVYYVLLSGYRMLHGMQIKETLYYSVVLFGSVALYMQLRDGRWRMSREELAANFKAILVYMILYKIIFTLLSEDTFRFSKLLGNPPINNLYSTSMLAMLLPFLVDHIRAPQKGKGLSNEVLVCLTMILIAICKSRIIFHLGIAMFMGLLLIHVRNRRVFLRVLTSGVCAVLVVAVLAAGNIAEVRDALNRATNLFPDTGKQTVSAEQETADSSKATAPTEDAAESAPQQETKPDPSQQKIQSQINKSDNMRSDLMKLALAEIKKNPWVGTGDLYYTYDMGYKTMEQTAHNFILESLVSYGLIGTAMIAVLLISMLVSSGFFTWKKQTQWQLRAGAYGVLMYYFALGMVQPSVYNTLLCPLFTALIEYYHYIFCTAKEN